MINLYDLSRNDLEFTYSANGVNQAFRVNQLYGWLYERRVDSFEAMTNLPKVIACKSSKLKTTCSGHAKSGH